MKRYATAGPIVAALAAVYLMPSAIEAQGQVEDVEPIVLGQSFSFQSELLDRAVPVTIRLPKGYRNIDGEYPILLVLSNQFHYACGVVHAVSRSRQIPEMIVVDVSRFDYGYLIPTPSQGGTKGLADSLAMFLQDELLPWIDSTYRTQPFRILYGSSWAGVFCMYAVLNYPNEFDAALAAGPWLIYDGEGQYFLTVMSVVAAETEYDGNFVFFSGGDQPEIVPDLEKFADSLRLHAPPGLTTVYKPMSGENHASLRDLTLYEGFRWLYEPWRELPIEVADGGVAAVREYVESLRSRFGYSVGLSSAAINSAARQQKSEGHSDERLRLLRLNAELNPSTPYVHWALGRALEDAGQQEEAMENLIRAVELAEMLSSANAPRWRTYVEKLKESEHR